MLRTLLKSDLPQLFRIEQIVHVTPWTEETFKLCFEAGYVGWVIELNHMVIGFIIVSLRADECHVLNIGVEHAYQKRGFGAQLLAKALDYAKQQGVRIIYLEVRRSNIRAISFYKKTEFQFIGERKNYYPTISGYEDALIFAKSL